MMEDYTILSLLLCLSVASAFSDYDVRLAGSNAANGRVEMFYEGAWGTVCDDYWGIDDAGVVCKQLGFSEGASAATTRAEPFGQGSGRVLLDDVKCTGLENRLIDCTAEKFGSATCQHSEDAGVRCRGAQRSTGAQRSALRLAGSGSSASQGRVEVYANEQWGTVCDDYWGLEDANVVCRQLGFPGASGFTTDAETFGAGAGSILLDNVKCVGDEASIMDCPKNDIGSHHCGHSEDAGVICREVRLAGSGSSANQGRVEVYANRQWGTVCDDYWGLEDANVVCRQLGFHGASVATTKAETFGAGAGSILLDNVKCVGDEASIMDCPKNEIRDNDCRHSEDAGVICNKATRKREGEDMESIHKIQEQMAADAKKDADLKKKDVLQALYYLLAELNDK